ncbi:MAG TPA: ornithine carbamoyltransferase [Alphaproteobacteria bacterium]|jgi:ornithine carbamoyltransferase|nr:MAG: ornithine carbamoyltransferase [SAR116 cluster bacterium MED-G06]HCV88078.1 ornithine carbamoyltransferase [Alphaproteobacteria bacterium]|tara:strand:+ start:3582 stop:4490 length:909 start_codon:yes stop_codon:yes gene_type:complete
MRHFLDLRDFDSGTLQAILDHAASMKAALKAGAAGERPLEGKSVAMIFEKPSTRTRVSFEVGITQLGGKPLMLSAQDLQIGRGESIEDTARVLSRYVDAITIRCFAHDTLLTLAEHATVPVVNALTARSHPCQIMADLQTMIERHGALDGQIVTWIGDGNNVAASWIEAAARFNFQLRLACPEGYAPPAELMAWARAEGADLVLYDSALEAARGSQTLVTDVWISMGDEEGTRREDFKPFQVNEELLAAAAGDAVVMHCLPAWRGMEITEAVIDGPQSAVFDEAENRLHAQKAVLAWCVSGN